MNFLDKFHRYCLLSKYQPFKVKNIKFWLFKEMSVGTGLPRKIWQVKYQQFLQMSKLRTYCTGE
jgi:pyruvate dehydrogenase complex dehydrogenase (E1) component